MKNKKIDDSSRLLQGRRPCQGRDALATSCFGVARPSRLVRAGLAAMAGRHRYLQWRDAIATPCFQKYTMYYSLTFAMAKLVYMEN